eukprot:scaffold8266_cov69-Isochrysis_galbana.AAC.1
MRRMGERSGEGLGGFPPEGGQTHRSLPDQERAPPELWPVLPSGTEKSDWEQRNRLGNREIGAQHAGAEYSWPFFEERSTRPHRCGWCVSPVPRRCRARRPFGRAAAPSRVRPARRSRA